MDVDGGLIVHARGKHLGACRRNRRVSQNDLRDDAAHCFNAERQRSDIEQQHLAVAGDQKDGRPTDATSALLRLKPESRYEGCSDDTSASISSTSSRSMSSPPRCVSPLVASTWNTPSSTRRMEMSNVPPPKS